LLRMDADTMTGRDIHGRSLAAFAAGEYDILLGTQMVAFGLDFPRVTLVGVVLADESLDLPDFRAAERVFQLVTQVVGRAGRADRPGRAVIQAFRPEHFAVQCALRQDHAAFAERELANRQAMGYPPFGRLARIVARSADPRACASRLLEVGTALRRAAPRPGMLLGPTACPIERLAGEWRQHILLKCRSHAELSQMLDCAAPLLKEKGGVKLSVDVDPLALL
ncbi:MAG: helicase-related protein, partial [Planctomycetota bacterium]|nr:helicase-related protein [Planctomycetota bacterium]